MSKAPYRDSLGDDDELPPPYTADGSDETLFASHLGSLRQQIDSEQATRSLSRDQIDSQTLALIIPHLEEVLSSIPSIHPPPTLVVTTFVPAAAVSSGWVHVEDNDKVRGESHKTVRVMRYNKAYGEKQPPQQPSQEQAAEREFDGWGRWQDDNISSASADSEAHMWWSDENMARRLAKHLQPGNQQTSASGKAIPSQSRQEGSRQSSGLRNILGRVANRIPEPLVSGNDQAVASSSRQQQQKGNVSLTVNAEEVTFRKENDFGLWESMTGWGIVARVRLGRG